MQSQARPLNILLIAFAAFVVIGIPGGMLNISWDYIQLSFSQTMDALGLILGAGMVGTLISTFASGRMIARFGPAAVLSIGTVIVIIGLVGFAIAPFWIAILLASFLVSMGAGAIDGGLNTFVAARYSAGQLNWLHACFGLGAAAGPLVVRAIVIEMGQPWQNVYYLAAVAALVLLGLLLITRKQWHLDKTSVEADGTVVSNDAGIMETLRKPVVLISLVMFMVFGGVEMGNGQLLNSVFVNERGIHPETSASWISFYWFSYTAGRLFIGFVVNRIGSRLLVRLCMLGMIIGGAMIWSNIANEITLAGLLLVGFSVGPVFPSLVADTPSRVGRRYGANAIGFQIGVTGIGVALLTGLGGSLSENFGLSVIAPYLLLLSVVTFLLHEVILRYDVHLLKRKAAAEQGS
jgi:fucose permease